MAVCLHSGDVMMQGLCGMLDRNVRSLPNFCDASVKVSMLSVCPWIAAAPAIWAVLLGLEDHVF